MSVKAVLSSLAGGRSSSASKGGGGGSLPLYSPLAPSEASSVADGGSHLATSVPFSAVSEIENDQLYPAPRRRLAVLQLPNMARFLADFTLGFADGLTVPFALTAGLSSLGQTDTVIYAGMAEICAGSISMGIGGYLSARGENAAAERGARGKAEKGAAGAGVAEGDDPDEDMAGSFELQSTTEKSAMMAPASPGPAPGSVGAYLAPLQLPEQLMALVVEHLEHRPDIAGALAAEARGDEAGAEEGERLPSPVAAGLSVSLGYLLGGLLPLFPYFFVSQVGDGLAWSFVVCVMALFVFGFSKDFALNQEARRKEQEEALWSKTGRARSCLRPIPWKAVRGSVWEGAQMVILGSVAAAAAVLCVRAFEGMHS